MRAEQSLLVKLAEGQMELKPVLQRLADGSTSASPAMDEARAHLRNIEMHLARLDEDVSQGRGDAVQEIRNEIRLLARTIAALAEEAERASPDAAMALSRRHRRPGIDIWPGFVDALSQLRDGHHLRAAGLHRRRSSS